MKCPYCGAEVVLKDASFVYHKDKTQKKLKGEKVWVCSNYPTCNSYVNCHKGTDIPIGRLANTRLRTLRQEAHKQFDVLWRSGLTSRQNAYVWLAMKLGLDINDCHIGMFDIKMAQKTIHICKEQDNDLLTKYRKENNIC